MLEGVPPSEQIPAKAKQVEYHLNGVTKESDFCAGTISPAHRDLCKMASLMLDEKEQFGIKAEAPCSLQKKGVLSGLTAK